MMLSTLSVSSGSKYSRVLASKSVDTVSGLELTITALQPAPAEDVRRLDGAVVELDPLPDPDRAAADDEGAGARRGRRLGRRAGRRVGRVEVRRLGRELRGAGVDHRVARREPELRARRRTAASGTPASPPRSWSRERGPLGGREQRGAGRRPPCRRSVAPAARTSCSRRMLRPISARNQGLIPVAARTTSCGTPAPEQAEDPPQPRVGRLDELLEHDRRRGALREPRALARLAALVDPADDGVLARGASGSASSVAPA